MSKNWREGCIMIPQNDPYPTVEKLGVRIDLAKRALENAQNEDFKTLWATVHSHLLRRLKEYKNALH